MSVSLSTPGRLLVASFALVALLGCTADGRSGQSTGAPPNSATRQTATEGGLQFTCELSAAAIPAGRLAVTLTLKNVSGQTITWSAIRFGLAATATSEVPTGSPDGVAEGITAAPGRFDGEPLALRSGEETQVVRSVGLGPGTWRVVAAYFGEGDAPSGQAPPITCVVGQ